MNPSRIAPSRGPTALASVAALVLVACSTPAPPADKPKVEVPAPEAKKELPKRKQLGGVDGPRERTQENIRKAFQADARVSGTNGRKCGVWRDKVILTQPNEGHEGNTLRIRPSTGDIDADCAWDGPVLVEARVDGEVEGVFWPHVVTFEEGPDRSGHIQVIQGTTGGVTAEVVNVGRPRYDRQQVIRFEVPHIFEVEREQGQDCRELIEGEWNKLLAELDEAGTVHPDLSRTLPHCPPEPMQRFCDRFAFLMPHELVLTDSAPRPASGEAGCDHLPKPR